MSSKTLMQWLHAAVKVLQAAADSEDFFDRVARAIVDLVRLDIGRVLLRRNGSWHTQSLQLPPRLIPTQVSPPSKSILHQVLNQKCTVWVKPADEEENVAQSLADLEAIVAAPMLDRNGEVVGVLYGKRQAQGSFTLGGITEVEAMLVELLALVVTAGLARLEHEQAALAERVRFEQFFTPDLTRQQPDHAVRACQATLEMLGRLPRLNATWSEVLGCPIELGVGINSGLAQVGNTGSRHKFKYGPRGNTIHLASRVEVAKSI